MSRPSTLKNVDATQHPRCVTIALCRNDLKEALEALEKSSNNPDAVAMFHFGFNDKNMNDFVAGKMLKIGSGVDNTALIAARTDQLKLMFDAVEVMDFVTRIRKA